MNRSSLTAVCLWLCSGWCFGAPAAGLLSLHRRPVVDQHPISRMASTQHPTRSRVFPSQYQQQQKKSAVAANAESAAPDDSGPPADQDAADTVGFNFGLGIGLDTPLIDSLLERLLRRKQLLMAAAAAAYPGVGNWGIGGGGGGGGGYFPGPAVVIPLGGGGGGVGGGGGGGILPWNRPAGYPFPFVPSLNSLNPFGGGGGGGGIGGGGWGGFGGGGGGVGGGGWGGGWGGFNPLLDFDDFGWKNNNGQQ